jgi:hypothetical protein
LDFVNYILSRLARPCIGSKDRLQTGRLRIGMHRHNLSDNPGYIKKSDLSLKESFHGKLVRSVQHGRHCAPLAYGIVGETEAGETLAIGCGKTQLTETTEIKSRQTQG